MTTRRRRPEQAIQRAVFAHLAARSARSVFAFHVPNGGMRSPIEGAILTGLGVVAGTPDIIAIRDGQAFGLELKARGGRITIAQNDCLARMRAAGAVIAVATGLDEALAQLEAWGLLRGIAQSGSGG